MARIRFTSALSRFFPDLREMETDAATVREALEVLEQKHPGIMNYLTDDDGQLRKHVNIFLGEEMIQDRRQLRDPLKPQDELLIFQALSGG